MVAACFTKKSTGSYITIVPGLVVNKNNENGNDACG